MINLKTTKELRKFIEDMKKLKRLAKSIHNYFIIDCNYGLTHKQEMICERRTEAIKEICKTWGLQYNINSDPRGASLTVSLDDVDLEYWRYDGIVIEEV